MQREKDNEKQKGSEEKADDDAESVKNSGDTSNRESNCFEYE